MAKRPRGGLPPTRRVETAPRASSKRSAPALVSAPGAHPTTYLIQIQDWSWDFYFGLNTMRGERSSEAFADNRHLKVAGRLLRPRGAPAEFAELTFLPSLELNPAAIADRRSDFEPKGVGVAYFSEGRLGGSIPIPHDVLPPLVTALSARRINFLSMEGVPLLHREILIRGVGFRANYRVEDDAPAVQGRQPRASKRNDP